MKVNPPEAIPAIRQMLLRQLCHALALYSETLDIAQDARITSLTPETIPLHRNDFVYKSALALKLAATINLSALDIATHIAACFPTSPYTVIEVASPGWIYFHLTNQGIAAWLQHLTMTPLTVSPPLEFFGDSASVFPIQYAHARCCSLLRLAHWQGLIKLSTQTNNTVGNILEPNPIPWLNADGQLYLVHSAEKLLISQLLGLLDAIARRMEFAATLALPACAGFKNRTYALECVSPTHLTLLKLAGNLSDAMTSFHALCRIWGEVKTQTPHLSQTRLGLVGVTRSLLRLTLQDILNAPAPVEF